MNAKLTEDAADECEAVDRESATSAARRPICKAGFAPAPAPRLSPTPEAQPEGTPRVWTQSLPRMRRRMRCSRRRRCQVMAWRSPGSQGRVSRANCLSPCPFLGFFGFGHSLRTIIGSQECDTEITIYVRERRRRWGTPFFLFFRPFVLFSRLCGKPSSPNIGS